MAAELGINKVSVSNRWLFLKFQRWYVNTSRLLSDENGSVPLCEVNDWMANFESLIKRPNLNVDETTVLHRTAPSRNLVSKHHKNGGFMICK